MYEDLVKQCRGCIDSLCGECKYEHLQKAGNFVPCMNALLEEAVKAIEELVDISNSLLSKYEEEAEATIWEYSGHINEDIDKLHKEIEDYKAQINGVAEPPTEET